MLELKMVYSTMIALIEFFVIYLLTKDFIQIKKWAKVLFFITFLAYEIYNMTDNVFDFGMDEVKLLCMVVFCIIFILGSRGKKLWNLIHFYCNILILRSSNQLFKLVFLTVYSKANMEVILRKLGEFSMIMVFFYMIFYLLSFRLTKYLWKQLTLCVTSLFIVVCLIMVVLLFTMELFSEWIQILITMPVLIVLFVAIILFRIESERVESHKLEYYKDLEEQMKEMDQELEEIRYEVEKYYKRAGETSIDYAEQLLEKIEHVRERVENENS